MLEKSLKLALCFMVILRGCVLNIKRNSSMSEDGGHQSVPNTVFTSKRSASISS